MRVPDCSYTSHGQFFPDHARRSGEERQAIARRQEVAQSGLAALMGSIGTQISSGLPPLRRAFCIQPPLWGSVKLQEGD